MREKEYLSAMILVYCYGYDGAEVEMRGAFIFVVWSWRLQRVYAVSNVPGWSLRSQAALPYEFAIGLSGLVGHGLATVTAAVIFRVPTTLVRCHFFAILGDAFCSSSSQAV